MHWAASEGSLQTVKLLLNTKYGFQLSKTVDFERHSPLQVYRMIMRIIFYVIGCSEVIGIGL